MVDTQLLDKKIKESGLKVGHIIEQLGISPQAFYKKKQNAYPFKGAEVYVICDLLKLSDDTKKQIFFAEDVERQTTKGA